MSSAAGLLILLGCVALAAAQEIADPGEPGYWVWLQGLDLQDGMHLSPYFTPKNKNYSVKITQEGVHSVRLNFHLDSSKYSMTFDGKETLPNIFIDDQPFLYSALDAVNLHTEVKLPHVYGPVKKTVRIRVADPKGDSTGFLGTGLFAGPMQEFVYTIHISKTPEFQNAIKATAIVVKDTSGQEFFSTPRFDQNKRAAHDEYKVVLPRHITSVNVSVACPDVDGGSVQTYNDKQVAVGSTFTVDMQNSLLQRVFVTCKYVNRAWSSMDYERIYVLDLDKHVESSEAQALQASLMPLPNYGYCEKVSSDDYRLMGKVAADDMSLLAVRPTSGFVCRVDSEKAVFVATYSSAVEALLKSSLVDMGTGIRTTMTNAMPVKLQVARDRQHYDLHVEAGDVAIDFPVVVLWPGACSSLQCPALQATKPMHHHVAKEHMCSEEICSIQDVAHCCVPRAACDSYPGNCPANQELLPHAEWELCKDAVCTAQDEATCCGWITTTTTTLTSTTATSTTITSSSTTNSLTYTESSTSSTTHTVSTTSATATSTSSSTLTHSTSTETSSTKTVTEALTTATTSTEALTTTNTTTGTMSTTSTSSASSTSSSTTSSSGTSTSTDSSTTSSSTKTWTGTSSTTTESSTTSSTSSSTSTSMVCIEENTAWFPLDLPNAPPTLEADRQACQDRCFNNPWCRHWSFWKDGGHCHLQGENATRNNFGFGFVAGPPECLPTLRIPTTTSNPISNNLRCVKAGVSWQPAIGTVGYYTGDVEENMQLCQERCARFPGCAHFMLDSSTGMCQLAGNMAELVVAPLSWHSGPPQCNDVFYEELSDLIMRKFQGTVNREQQAPHANTRGGAVQELAETQPPDTATHGFAPHALAAAAALGLLPLGIVAGRWRRRPTTYSGLTGAAFLAEDANE